MGNTCPLSGICVKTWAWGNVVHLWNREKLRAPLTLPSGGGSRNKDVCADSAWLLKATVELCTSTSSAAKFLVPLPSS